MDEVPIMANGYRAWINRMKHLILIFAHLEQLVVLGNHRLLLGASFETHEVA